MKELAIGTRVGCYVIVGQERIGCSWYTGEVIHLQCGTCRRPLSVPPDRLDPYVASVCVSFGDYSAPKQLRDSYIHQASGVYRHWRNQAEYETWARTEGVECLRTLYRMGESLKQREARRRSRREED